MACRGGNGGAPCWPRGRGEAKGPWNPLDRRWASGRREEEEGPSNAMDSERASRLQDREVAFRPLDRAGASSSLDREWVSNPLSPQSGRGWSIPNSWRELSPPSSRATYWERSSSSFGRDHPSSCGGSPEVSRGRWESPGRKSRRRNWEFPAKVEDPSGTWTSLWEADNPSPRRSGSEEWGGSERLWWPEKPAGSSRWCSSKMRWGDPEDQSDTIAVGGSGEWQRGRGVQSFARGHWGSRGRGGCQDPSGEQKAWGGPAWEEGPEDIGNFCAHSPFDFMESQCACHIPELEGGEDEDPQNADVQSPLSVKKLKSWHYTPGLEGGEDEDPQSIDVQRPLGVKKRKMNWEVRVPEGRVDPRTPRIQGPLGVKKRKISWDIREPEGRVYQDHGTAGIQSPLGVKRRKIKWDVRGPEGMVDQFPGSVGILTHSDLKTPRSRGNLPRERKDEGWARDKGLKKISSSKEYKDVQDSSTGAFEERIRQACQKVKEHLDTGVGGSTDHPKSLKLQRCLQILRTIDPSSIEMTGQNYSGPRLSEANVLKPTVNTFPEVASEKPPKTNVTTVPLQSHAGSEGASAQRHKQSSALQANAPKPPIKKGRSLGLWHRRFGHVDPMALLELDHRSLATGIRVDPDEAESIASCAICLKVKGGVASFPLTPVNCSSKVLDLIHCELCEPFNVLSRDQHKYVLIFVDDFSRYCVAYLLTELEATGVMLNRYLAFLTNIKGNPKAFQINRMDDRFSKPMERLLEQNGIPHKRGVVSTPGQSRTAEREMKSLVEMARCMLADTKVPKNFWGHAIKTATYLWNRLPVGGSSSTRTPFHLWRGSRPIVKHLRVFGSLVYRKFEPEGHVPLLLIGYTHNNYAYKVMDLGTTQVIGRVPLRYLEKQVWVEGKGAFLGAFPEQGHETRTLLATAGSTPSQPELDGKWPSAREVRDETEMMPSNSSGPLSTEDRADLSKAVVKKFPEVTLKEPPNLNAIPLQPHKKSSDQQANTAVPQTEDVTSLEIWHRRFGHADPKAILELQTHNLATGIKVDPSDAESIASCAPCLRVKGAVSSFPLTPVKSSTQILDLIHCELYKPFNVQSRERLKYVLIFVDDFSRYCVTFLLNRLKETDKMLMRYVSDLSNAKGKPKAFQINSTDYCFSRRIECVLQRHGIPHKRSIVSSPGESRTAKREMKSLVQMAWCMLGDTQLPNKFWDHAISTATYLWNRLPVGGGSDAQTPFYLWFGEKPTVGHLRIFGSLVYPNLEPDSQPPLLLIGYVHDRVAYNVMDFETGQVTTRDAFSEQGQNTGALLATAVSIPSQPESDRKQQGDEAETAGDGNGDFVRAQETSVPAFGCSMQPLQSEKKEALDDARDETKMPVDGGVVEAQDAPAPASGCSSTPAVSLLTNERGARPDIEEISAAESTKWRDIQLPSGLMGSTPPLPPESEMKEAQDKVGDERSIPGEGDGGEEMEADQPEIASPIPGKHPGPPAGWVLREEVKAMIQERLDQSLMPQHSVPVLEATNPLSIETTGQHSSGPVLAGDEADILKATIKMFPEGTPEMPPEMNVKHDVSRPTLVAVPQQSHAASEGVSAQQPKQSSAQQAKAPQLVIQDFAGLELWHRRFAHANPKAILELENRDLARGIKVDPWDAERTARCETCLRVKGSMASFPLDPVKSTAQALDLIHCDLYEPFNSLSQERFKYVLILVDDFSRYCITFLLNRPRETDKLLFKYMTDLRKAKGKPKAFEIHNMDERFLQRIERFLEKRGIPYKRSVVSNSGQSRTAEREMKSLLEMAQCMVGDTGLPDNFWGHAIRTAAYLWNRLPVSGSTYAQTPYHLCFGQQPTVGHLRVFGSLLYQTDQPPLLLVGYVHNGVTYNVMNFETGQVTTRVVQYLEKCTWVEERGAFLDAFPVQGHHTGSLLPTAVSTPSQPESDIKQQGDEALDEAEMESDGNKDLVRAQEASVLAFRCSTQPAQSERKEAWDNAGDETKMPVDGGIIESQEAPAGPISIEKTSQNSSGLLLAGDKASLLKAAVKTFPGLTTTNVKLDYFRPNLIVVPLQSRAASRGASAQQPKQRSAQQVNAPQPQIEDVASLELWHRRFAHADPKAILEIQERNLATGIRVDPGDAESTTRCETCLKVKGGVASFPLEPVKSSTQVLDLVHCELCEPFNVTSRERFKYALIFVDDFSRYCISFLLRELEDTGVLLSNYVAFLKRMKRKPKAFQINNMDDRFSHPMESLLEQYGIPHKRGVVSSPGQSRTAEREVKSLVEMVQCMLGDTQLPDNLWGDGIKTATYLWNRLPVSGGSNAQTPFYLWFGQQPTVRHLRVFGSLVYQTSQPPLLLIGYAHNRVAYNVMNFETRQVTARVVQYFEKCMWVEERGAFVDAFPGQGHHTGALLATAVLMPSQPERDGKQQGDEGRDAVEMPGDKNGSLVTAQEASVPAFGCSTQAMQSERKEARDDTGDKTKMPVDRGIVEAQEAPAFEPSSPPVEPLPINKPATRPDIEETPAAEAPPLTPETERKEAQDKAGDEHCTPGEGDGSEEVEADEPEKASHIPGKHPGPPAGCVPHEEVVAMIQASLDQSLRPHNSVPVLGASNPLSIETISQDSSMPLLARDKANLLKVAVKTFPEVTPEKPPEMNAKRDLFRPNLIVVPLQSHAASENVCAPSSAQQVNAPQPQIDDVASLELWHRRFAHVDPMALFELDHRNLATGIRVDPDEAESIARCAICLKVKGGVASFPLMPVNSSSTVLDLIHCELCEPFNVLSLDQHKYVLIFVDDFSRYCVSFLLSELQDTGVMLSRYVAFLKRMMRNPKEFQINSMDDRFSHPMESLLEQYGIPHKRGIRSSPGQSRTAEREVKSLVEMAQCMLGDTQLPDYFWGHAIRTATYLWNRLPVSGGNDAQTPFHLWFGQQPTVRHLRVFGSLVHQTSQPPLLLIGYVHNSVAYNVMNFETGQVTTRVVQYLEKNRWVEEKGAFVDAFPGQGHHTGSLLAPAVLMPSQPESDGKRQEAEDETAGDRNGDLVRAQEASVPAFRCSTQLAQSEQKEARDNAEDEAEVLVDRDIITAEEVPVFGPLSPTVEPLLTNETLTRLDIEKTPAMETTKWRDIEPLPGTTRSTPPLTPESKRKEAQDKAGDEHSTPGEGDGGEEGEADEPKKASHIPGKHPGPPAGWVPHEEVEVTIQESLNQSVTPHHSVPVLEVTNPLSIETTSQKSSNPLLAGDEVNLLKAAVKTFPEVTPEKPPEMNAKRDFFRPNLIVVPLQSHAASEGASALSSAQKVNAPQPQIEDVASLDLWHRRFAHADPKAILELQDRDLATGIKVDPVDAERTASCETCLRVKGAVASFPLEPVKSSTQVLDLVHCELCEPFNVLSKEQFKYALVFVDDFSRFCTTYLLSDLHETGVMLNRYLNMKNIKEEKPKAFQINSADEDFSQRMESLLEKAGLPYKRNIERTPGQSRTAERELRSLLEMTHCMLVDAKLPSSVWSDAIRTATYLWNRLPGTNGTQTPFHLWFGEEPSVRHLRVFGSLAYHKPEPNSQPPLLFIGYIHNHVAYIVMDLETGQVSTRPCRYLEQKTWVEERGAFLHAFPGNHTGALLATALSAPLQPELDGKQLDNNIAQDEAEMPGDGDLIDHQEASVQAFGHSTQPTQSEIKEERDVTGDETKIPVNGDVIEDQVAPVPVFGSSLQPVEPLLTNEPATQPDIEETLTTQATKWRGIKKLPSMTGSMLTPLESERKEARDDAINKTEMPVDGDVVEAQEAPKLAFGLSSSPAEPLPTNEPANWHDIEETPAAEATKWRDIKPLPGTAMSTLQLPPDSKRKEARDNARDEADMTIDRESIEAQEGLAPAFGPLSPAAELLPMNEPPVLAVEAMKWKDIELLPGTTGSTSVSERKEAQCNAVDKTEMAVAGNSDIPGEENSHTPGEDRDTPREGVSVIPGEENSNTPGEDSDIPLEEVSVIPGEGNSDIPGEENSNTPEEDSDTPGEGVSVLPGVGNSDVPGEENSNTPGEDSDTPGEGVSVIPGEGNSDIPGEENSHTPREYSDIPGEVVSVIPGEGNSDIPGEENSHTLGEDSDTPGEGVSIIPGEENSDIPGEENSNTPGEDSNIPGDGDRVIPGEENSDMPGERDSDIVGEGDSIIHGEGTSDIPGEGAGDTPGEGDGDEEPGPPCVPEPAMGHSKPLPMNRTMTWEDIAGMPADEVTKWCDTAREEIEGLRKNEAWTLTKLPPGKQAVRCKWVLKVKPGPEGQAGCYTARLVLQDPGEDTDATVTPDVKQSTIRMLLNLSATNWMQVKRLDVKTAFLHGAAYMEQPPGFVDQEHPDWVCKLKDGLRGMEGAARAWSEKLKTILFQQGFKRDEADRSLYTRSKKGQLMFILNCVDDLVVAYQQEQDYNEIVHSLDKEMVLEELGDATCYLDNLIERVADDSSLLK